MRRIHGLESLHRLCAGRINVRKLAAILLEDLQHCCFSVYGCLADGEPVLLAQLDLLPETLVYDDFDKGIRFTVAGHILRNDVVPLTYRLQGRLFAVTGRCSVLPKICGVDLYLQRNYTSVVGDNVRQNFSFPITPLLKNVEFDERNTFC